MAVQVQGEVEGGVKDDNNKKFEPLLIYSFYCFSPPAPESFSFSDFVLNSLRNRIRGLIEVGTVVTKNEEVVAAA